MVSEFTGVLGQQLHVSPQVKCRIMKSGQCFFGVQQHPYRELQRCCRWYDKINVHPLRRKDVSYIRKICYILICILFAFSVSLTGRYFIFGECFPLIFFDCATIAFNRRYYRPSTPGYFLKPFPQSCHESRRNS